MGTPELIYASNEHGISLNTFYTKSEPWEPTILVIKTTDREVIFLLNWSVCTVLKNMAITVHTAQRWDLAVFGPLSCISTYKQMKPISRSF